MTPATSLSRVLGLVEVTAGGVGIIIGAGIYVLLGAAAAQAGAAVWQAFVIAAILSALTGLSNGIASVVVMLVHLDPLAAGLGMGLAVLGLLSGWLIRSQARRSL